MTNPFRVTCNLCSNEDDLRQMGKFRGEYYHKVKKKGNRTTCLQAAKDGLTGKD